MAVWSDLWQKFRRRKSSPLATNASNVTEDRPAAAPLDVPFARVTPTPNTAQDGAIASTRGDPLADATAGGKVGEHSHHEEEQNTQLVHREATQHVGNTLKEELRAEIDTALQARFDALEQKLDLVHSRLNDSLHEHIRIEIDRVIKEAAGKSSDLVTVIPSRDERASSKGPAAVKCQCGKGDQKEADEPGEVEDPTQLIEGFNEKDEFFNNVFSGFKDDFAGEDLFIRILGDVAEVHQCVAVAVLAFKVCYTLYTEYRRNDRRVEFLFRAMRDMIGELAQLKELTSEQLNGSIREKLQASAEGAEKDMKACTKICALWSKKSVFKKSLSSLKWASRFAAFSEAFRSRRQNFRDDLQYSMAATLQAVHSNVQDMRSKLDHIPMTAQIFIEMRTPDEEKLAAKIEDLGGRAVILNSNILLPELFRIVSSATYGKGDYYSDNNDKHGRKAALQHSNISFDELRKELDEEDEEIDHNNSDAFDKKFELLYNQFASLRSYIHQEINEGPHQLVRDTDLQHIWKQQNWRYNVKAKHLVVTLHDYFSRNFTARIAKQRISISAEGMPKDDWCYQYVNIKYLRSLMDALDDDASGYVTIEELNEFTKHIPRELGWSLPAWLAYWAVGWEFFAAKYSDEILETFARMFAMRNQILLENQDMVHDYLTYGWLVAYQLAKSPRPRTSTDSVPLLSQHMFDEFMDREEKRISKNLQAINYNIDSKSAIDIVLDRERLEKYILMLLCLLLRKHFAVFQLATQTVLRPSELWDAAETLYQLYRIVHMRYSDLAAQVDSMGIDISAYMGRFAYKIFGYYHQFIGGHNRSEMLSNIEPEPIDHEISSKPPQRMPLNPQVDYVPDHAVYCDFCGTRCHGSRYICLECTENVDNDRRYWDTVDFCQSLCTAKTVQPSHLSRSHSISHDLLKVRIHAHWIWDLAPTYKRAKNAIEIIQRTFLSSIKGLQMIAPMDSSKFPVCSICEKTVAAPCWVCLQCMESEGSAAVYLCDHCEEQSLLKCLTCENVFKQPRWYYGSNFGDGFQCDTCIAENKPGAQGRDPHTYLHYLIRFHLKDVPDKERTSDEKLAAIDKKVVAMDERIVGLEGYLQRIERHLNALNTSGRPYVESETT